MLRSNKFVPVLLLSTVEEKWVNGMHMKKMMVMWHGITLHNLGHRALCLEIGRQADAGSGAQVEDL